MVPSGSPRQVQFEHPGGSVVVVPQSQPGGSVVVVDVVVVPGVQTGARTSREEHCVTVHSPSFVPQNSGWAQRHGANVVVVVLVVVVDVVDVVDDVGPPVVLDVVVLVVVGQENSVVVVDVVVDPGADVVDVVVVAVAQAFVVSDHVPDAADQVKVQFPPHCEDDGAPGAAVVVVLVVALLATTGCGFRLTSTHRRLLPSSTSSSQTMVAESPVARLARCRDDVMPSRTSAY